MTLLTLGRVTLTFTVAFLLLLPVAVMVQWPVPFAVIRPEELTVATFLLELVQVTFLLLALDGDIVTFS